MFWCVWNVQHYFQVIVVTDGEDRHSTTANSATVQAKLEHPGSWAGYCRLRTCFVAVGASAVKCLQPFADDAVPNAKLIAASDGADGIMVALRRVFNEVVEYKRTTYSESTVTVRSRSVSRSRSGVAGRDWDGGHGDSVGARSQSRGRSAVGYGSASGDVTRSRSRSRVAMGMGCGGGDVGRGWVVEEHHDRGDGSDRDGYPSTPRHARTGSVSAARCRPRS